MTFARHMAVQFRKAGLPALYTPPAGPAVNCHVMRAVRPLRFGHLDLPVDGACFDLLRSQVTPEPGGVLAIDGVEHTVDMPPIAFPSDSDPEGLRWRLLCGWGAVVTYRAATGNQGTMNPPSGSDWTAVAPAGAGDAVISIKGVLAAGRLLPGDTVTVGGMAHTVTVPVQAVASTFAAIPVSPPLAAPVPAGAPVVLVFACDRPLRALVQVSTAEQPVSGVAVGAQRLLIPQVALDAAGITAPDTASTIVLAGRPWRIRSAVAEWAGAAAWLGAGPTLWDVRVGG